MRYILREPARSRLQPSLLSEFERGREREVRRESPQVQFNEDSRKREKRRNERLRERPPNSWRSLEAVVAPPIRLLISVRRIALPRDWNGYGVRVYVIFGTEIV